MNVRHVYVHVPFCHGRCGYCSFHAGLGSADAMAGWREQLAGHRRAAEARWGPPPRLESLYLGGGSPTVLPPDMLDTVLAELVADWPLAPDAEVTVEVNPATLTPAHAGVFQRYGVTRASLGAQSFDARALAFLQRDCRPEHVARAVGLLRDYGIPSLGLDLILGIPERDAPWTSDLDAAAALGPDHLSAYWLTIERGTPLARRHAAGDFTLLPDDQAAAILDAAEDRLADHGFEQYEISNFARAGHACRHNLNTWQGGDYLGLGPTACSRIGRERRQARPDGVLEDETLAAEDDWTERILFMPRTQAGLDLEAFQAAHPDVPATLRAFWTARCRELARHGLLDRAGTRWVPTRHGRRRADAIAEALLPELAGASPFFAAHRPCVGGSQR